MGSIVKNDTGDICDKKLKDDEHSKSKTVRWQEDETEMRSAAPSRLPQKALKASARLRGCLLTPDSSGAGESRARNQGL